FYPRIIEEIMKRAHLAERPSGGFRHQTLTPTLFAGSNIIEYTCRVRRQASRDLGDGARWVSLKRVDATTIECTGTQSGRVSARVRQRAKPEAPIGRLMMATKWSMRGTLLGACNCDWGCPCSFDA